MRHLLVALVALGSATSLAAQTPEDCSYEACALLRVDNDILAGSTRTPITSFGWFSPPDAAFMAARSNEAARSLRVTEENFTSGQIMGFVGVVAAVGGALALHILEEPASRPSTGEWIALGFAFSGTGLAFFGDRRVKRAKRAFDQAIWWYNGTLMRPE